MLPPGPHNGLESAAKLYTNDYFVNTFRRSILNDLDPFLSSSQSPAGRDLGLQLRGLVFGGHLEARAGVFQGVRANGFRQGSGSPPRSGRSTSSVLPRGCRSTCSTPRPGTSTGDVSRLEEDLVVRRLLRLREPVPLLRRRRLPRSAARTGHRHRAGGLRAVEGRVGRHGGSPMPRR